METIRGILKGLVDLIFPAMPCPLCGAGFNPTGPAPEGMVVCKSCRERIPFITPPICSRCGKPLRGAEMGSRLCLDCATFGRAFEVARAVGVYDGLLREYIHHMKYRGNRVVGEVLGMLMAGPVLRNKPLRSAHMIVPVPLSNERLASRGFNQAELLAAGLARVIGTRVVPEALSRVEVTRPQSKLRAAGRRYNLKGAFVARYPGLVAGKSVLLVDDVLTTGATADQCAVALLRAGALRVVVVTAARGMVSKFLFTPGGTIHNTSKSSIICVKNTMGRGHM